MKKCFYSCARLGSIATVTLLAGCATFNNSEPPAIEPTVAGKTYHSLSDVQCQPLTMASGKNRAKVVVNEFTSRLEQPEGKTPIVAFSVPGNGYHQISIDSYVVKSVVKSAVKSGAGQGGEELFYPEIALLDQNSQLISKLDSHSVGYKKPGFTTPEGVGASFTIDNRALSGRKAHCIVIYTTDDLRQKKTTLINDAKEYARVRGVVPPPIPDPIARHGDTGNLAITIKSSETFGAAPVAVTPPAQSVMPTPAQLPETDNYLSSVKEHYVSGVRNALEQGEISKALDLRSELKEVSKATESFFISQYGKPKDQLAVPAAPEKAGYATEVMHHLQGSIVEKLKRGEGAAALKQVDKLRAVQEEVDRLFDR
ncbi:MAG: MalM family protein [Endozoicomonas sp.]